MSIEDVYSLTAKVVSGLQEAEESAWGLKKIEVLLSDSKRALFELCESMDEEGLDDADEAEMADALTDVLDMIEDMIGEIEDGEIGTEDAYEEIADIIDALNELE